MSFQNKRHQREAGRYACCVPSPHMRLSGCVGMQCEAQRGVEVFPHLRHTQESWGICKRNRCGGNGNQVRAGQDLYIYIVLNAERVALPYSFFRVVCTFPNIQSSGLLFDPPSFCHPTSTLPRLRC